MELYGRHGSTIDEEHLIAWHTNFDYIKRQDNNGSNNSVSCCVIDWFLIIIIIL